MNMNMNMNVTVNTRELKKILDLTPTGQNVMLVGRHAIGKSEILSEYYKSKGQKVISFFLGQMSDPGDLIGLPHKNETSGKTEFMPPYWFPTDGEPIVLFLDELNRARPEILQTVMDLTLNRTLAGRKLPAGSRIISAVNDGEEYQLTDLDPALVSRFNIYRFRPTVAEWLIWAEENKVDKRIITFISKDQNWLDDDGSDEETDLDRHPDRRSWKRVSDIICSRPELETIDKKLIAGIVGTKAAAKFMQFVASENTLTGSEVLLKWDTYRTKVQKLQLHELSMLNESIFRFLETMDEVTTNKNTISSALESYLKHLSSNRKNEAYAHWVSLFSSNDYPHAVLFIMTQKPAMYKEIMKFVKNL